MAKSYLTEAAVERVRRPQVGRTEIKDAEPGLFLWVTPTGTKSWVVIFRLPDAAGKRSVRHKMVLGRHPGMGVAAARTAARAAKDLAAVGIDPARCAAEEQKVAELEAAAREARLFRVVAVEYVAAMRAGKLVGGRKRPVSCGTAAGRESLLTRCVLPVLGDVPLGEVTPAMIARLLAQLEKEGGPADAALKSVRGVFRFAQSRGLHAGQPPTAGMSNRQAPVKEVRALTDLELRAIWRATKRAPLAFGAVVRLLMLTGQRRSEIAGLRWNEVDWDRALLVIPADRVKSRAGAHEVPLTEAGLTILRAQRAAVDALGLTSELVFPSETGVTPLSGWTQLRARLDRVVRGELAGLTLAEWQVLRAGGALRAETRELKAVAERKISDTLLTPWRLHDLRHTFITRCRDGDENAAGEITWSAPLDVLQATVNHEITAGVTQRYDHGDIQRRYRLRKRELMEWWGRKLAHIVGDGQGSIIVPAGLLQAG